MQDAVGPLLLIAAGSLPGAIASIATISLWRQHLILDEEVARLWLRVGYGWLALFCLVAVLATGNMEGDPAAIALGWIGAPSFFSILGLWVFSERQRMTLEEFPSPRRMHTLSVDNRQELRYLISELSNDLNRGLSTQASLQRGAAMMRDVGLSQEELERALQRIRRALQKGHELEARYNLHLKRLKTLLEETNVEGYLYNADQERLIADLQDAQHDLDRQLDKLIDQAVEGRTGVNRVLSSITWM